MSGLMIIFSSSIEFLFERTAITSIARFNLSKSGQGRVRSFLNLPSLKLSLTEFAWISLLSLDKIETELSISCLTLSEHFVPFEHSLIPYTTKLYLRSSNCLVFGTGCLFIVVVGLLAEVSSAGLTYVSCGHLKLEKVELLKN